MKMLDHYRNAYLTISVLDSPGPDYGILNPKEPSPPPLFPSVIPNAEENLYLRSHLPEQREITQNSLLNSRA